jgi:hypothetical protein
MKWRYPHCQRQSARVPGETCTNTNAPVTLAPPCAGELKALKMGPSPVTVTAASGRQQGRLKGGGAPIARTAGGHTPACTQREARRPSQRHRAWAPTALACADTDSATDAVGHRCQGVPQSSGTAAAPSQEPTRAAAPGTESQVKDKRQCMYASPLFRQAEHQTKRCTGFAADTRRPTTHCAQRARHGARCMAHARMHNAQKRQHCLPSASVPASSQGGGGHRGVQHQRCLQHRPPRSTTGTLLRQYRCTQGGSHGVQQAHQAHKHPGGCRSHCPGLALWRGTTRGTAQPHGPGVQSPAGKHSTGWGEGGRVPHQVLAGHHPGPPPGPPPPPPPCYGSSAQANGRPPRQRPTSTVKHTRVWGAAFT